MTCFYLSQGKIACANVLSDLYAMGITECDNMLMLLSVSQKMNDKVCICLYVWILSASVANLADAHRMAAVNLFSKALTCEF